MRKEKNEIKALNKNCGVEQRTRFPDNKNFPKDGKLASGGYCKI